MSFITDEQTLNDLNIFGKRGGTSVYELFNKSQTQGGAEMLGQMFRYPLSEINSINYRSSIIQYFRESDIEFPCRGELFANIEQYLSNTDERSRLTGETNSMERGINKLITGDTEFQQLAGGVSALIELLHCTRQFIGDIRMQAPGSPYRTELEQMRTILEDNHWKAVWETKPGRKPGYSTIVSLDRIFRFVKRDQLKKLMGLLYQLDVYLAVAGVAEEMDLTFPLAQAPGKNGLVLEDIRHPLLPVAVSNSIRIDPRQNIVFLTGANMAGKSTFMKTVGIALYLAHMGFPVTARQMEFPVLDGLLSTINLPDNLSMGYSHFYGEVLRLKKVVNEMSASKKLFIIFDELFRGTNVKDAQEATVALLDAFSKRKDCIFLISTHIVEAGEALQKMNDSIQYTFLPTRMEGNHPVYTYKLEPGITEDRHGMLIINNEGILDIIRNRNNKQ